MKEILEKLKAYRFPLLILLLGVALMLLPSAPSRSPAAEASLGEALSLTQGVGEAYVLISDSGVVVVCDGADNAASSWSATGRTTRRCAWRSSRL